MFYWVVTAGLEDIIEADHVRLDIGIGILNRVAYSSLCGQVYHNIELFFSEEAVDESFVGEVTLHETVWLAHGGLVDLLEAILLEARVVVVVHIVKAHQIDLFSL